jgi:predicted nucleic acid binding AN1-type Zn finger protein
MADEADLAFDSEQRYLTNALAAQRRRGAPLQPAGYCHHCGNEEGIGQRLFCDADCAGDWEYQDALRRKLGLRAGASLAAAGGGVHAAA